MRNESENVNVNENDNDNDNNNQNIFLINIIMSYYLFNRQEILQKAKKRYSKEKAVEYYLQNKDVFFN